MDPAFSKTSKKELNVWYVTIKESKYVKINIVNPLYLIFSKVNVYVEKIDKNKYLKLFPSNESKEIIKKYEELLSKIRDLVRSATKNSDDCDEKYLKIKWFGWQITTKENDRNSQHNNSCESCFLWK